MAKHEAVESFLNSAAALIDGSEAFVPLHRGRLSRCVNVNAESTTIRKSHTGNKRKVWASEQECTLACLPRRNLMTRYIIAVS